MNYEELESERRAVIENITKAFHGVTRDGGISWFEAGVIDDYGTDEERAAARARDTESGWTELLDNPKWNYGHGSNFSFLDPIGYRYYIAPAMILTVQGTSDFLLASGLTARLPDADEFHLHLWSLLDPRQIRAVGRFLRYMFEATRARYAEAEAEIDDPEGWGEAYASYWKAKCEGHAGPDGGDRGNTRKK